jgi:zinc protease
MTSVITLALIGALSVAADVDRTQPPAPGAEPTFTPPTPARFKAHGLDGYLVERHDLPIVEMIFGFNSGAVLDPAGKEGMNGLCSDLIGEGTKDLDKNALEDKKADNAIVVDIGAGTEAAQVHVRATKENIGAALDLAGQLLVTPGMRQADFERLKAQRKAAVLQEKGSADAVAQRVLGPVMFGKGHPYGHIVTEKSLDAVTLDDCKKVAQQLAPDGAFLLVTGDVTAAEVSSLLDAHMAQWKGKAPAQPRIGPPQPQVKGTLFFVDVPGAAQSRIIVGHMGPSRKEADYYATTVMAQVLGSGLPSRIVQNLREKNGYTYGANGGFRYLRSTSTMTIASSVRTDATAKALREVKNELKAYASDKPPTDDEIARERTGNMLAFPARFGTGSSTLGSLWELLFYGLPLDTYAKMQGEWKSLTVPAVQKALKDRLRTDNLVVVVAGDKAKVFDEMKDVAALFGKDGVVVLDGDAVPLK